ncbi:MAG TPA: HEAT repeat domain-containing protein [Pirellulales bacterium]|nr:HEAT repeat domain-containing protein [Pirellulales bacterium]
MLQRLVVSLGLTRLAKERRRRRLLSRFPTHIGLIDSRGIPLNSGCPDLSYYTESPEFYYGLIVDSVPHLKGKLPVATEADRQMGAVANNRIVNAIWGLIACGAKAVPYAIKLVRSTDRDEREAAAGVFCGLRDPARVTEIVAEIVAALETENDRLVVDSLLGALGHLRSRDAIPVVARFVMNADEDSDTRFGAAESLGQIVNRRFDKDGAHAVDNACAWLVSHSYHP